MSRPHRPAAAARVAAAAAAAAAESEDEDEQQQVEEQQDEEDAVNPMDWLGGGDAASDDEGFDRGRGSSSKGNAAQRRMLAVFEKGVRGVLAEFGIFLPADLESNRRVWYVHRLHGLLLYALKLQLSLLDS